MTAKLGIGEVTQSIEASKISIGIRGIGIDTFLHDLGRHFTILFLLALRTSLPRIKKGGIQIRPLPLLGVDPTV